MGLYEEIHIDEWPDLYEVTQKYERPLIKDAYSEVQARMRRSGVKFAKDEEVAVAVGSRFIANIKNIVRATIGELKSCGARPYIISAMGSHGGATAQGQKEVLDNLGITSEAMGVDVVYDLEWERIGDTGKGMPVYFSKRALSSDAIVLINRIKRHTNFRGPVESGLVKMAVVGLGKHRGALTIHSGGFENFAANLLELYKKIKERAPIRLGLAIVENAYDETAFIEAIPGDEILSEEPRLLALSNTHVPRIPFNNIDVLVVKNMGKDISGDGMDPNVTGRFSSSITPDYNTTPHISRIAALDLTDESHGSAVGVGYADFITQKLYEKISPMVSYTNAITATAPGSVKIPPIMPNDRIAIEAAFHTCPNIPYGKARLCIVNNTLQLEKMYASGALLEEVANGADVFVAQKSRALLFDENGGLMI